MEKQSLVTNWIRVDLICDDCDVPFEDTGNRKCSMGGVITHKVYRCPRCGTTMELPIDKSYPHYVGVSQYVEKEEKLFETHWVDVFAQSELVTAISKEQAKQKIRNKYDLDKDVYIGVYCIEKVGKYKILLVKE